MFSTIFILILLSCKKEYPEIDEASLGTKGQIQHWNDLPQIQIEGFTVHAIYPENLPDIYPDVYFKINFDTLIVDFTTIATPLTNVGISSNLPPVTYDLTTPLLIETDLVDSTASPYIDIDFYDVAAGSNPLIIDYKIFFKVMQECYQNGITLYYLKNEKVIVSINLSFLE